MINGGRPLEVRVRADDRRRNVPELHVRASQADPRLNVPADTGAPGERIEARGRVFGQPPAELPAGSRQDVEVPARHAGIRQQLGELERTQGCRSGRLQDDAVPARERGGDLVEDRADRRVERRDRADHPDRHAERVREVSFEADRALDRQHLAADAPNLLGGVREDVDRPPDLVAHVLPGEASLRHLDRQEYVVPFLEETCGLLERLVPLDRMERDLPERPLGDRHGVVDVGLPRPGHPRDHLPGELVVHGVRLGRRDPLAVDVQAVILRGHRLRHLSALRGRAVISGARSCPRGSCC